jgi:hypothetical protein
MPLSARDLYYREDLWNTDIRAIVARACMKMLKYFPNADLDDLTTDAVSFLYPIRRQYRVVYHGRRVAVSNWLTMRTTRMLSERLKQQGIEDRALRRLARMWENQDRIAVVDAETDGA